jgi:hypothetical protein
VLPPPIEIPKMDPEKKEWWAEALESDRFRKGRGFLRQRLNSGLTYHCCLGVLCEVAIEHGVDLDVSDPGVEGETFFDSEAMLLPKKVVEWAGLDRNGPEVWHSRFADDDGTVKAELTMVNDDTEADFTEIAAMIRASL